MQNFLIISPVYNAEKYIEKCCNSVIIQEYPLFTHVVVDDASADKTAYKVTNYPSYLIKNARHNGSPVFNTKKAIDRYGSDEDVIVILDGDDWFPHENVLNELSEEYDNGAWMTWGQYLPLSGSPLNFNKPVENTQTYRHSRKWHTTALRTFKKWLWDKIKVEDLKVNGKWACGASDRAYMYPMIEMSGGHGVCMKNVLYIYNDIHGQNFMYTMPEECDSEAEYFMNKPTYKEL